MRPGGLASVLCVLTCAAPAQNLAPEVLLLARIRSHLRDELAHLPNYTCLETITRFHKDPARGSRLRPLDTVRMEIGYSGGREFYGLPGDRSFSEDNPAALAGAGMSADFIFGTTLYNLFVADSATFTSRGEDSIDGRQALKYDFGLPRFMNRFRISTGGSAGTVGMEGSFWADPQSLDLLRLDVRATEIPDFLPLAGMESTVTYARTRIGEFDAMLAQRADLHLLNLDGTEAYNRFDFTHCRVFQASSTIRFDANPGEPAKAAAESEGIVPAALPVTIRLTTPITDRDAPGMPIEGRVVGEVRSKGGIVLEDGAPVRGRVRRLDVGVGGGHVVGLEFTEVQARGVPLRFYADLLSVEKRKGVEPAPREEARLPGSTAGSARIALPELPGVASLSVVGKTFLLPAGFRTFWRTRDLPRGAR